MKVYDGSTWVAAYASLSGALIAASNLSDLSSVSSARTNLGLGTAATTDSTDYATAAQGALADSAVQPSDNISGLTNDSGYITDYTVTEGDVTAHQAALSITESQISDLGTYLTASDVSGKVDSTGDSMTGDLSFGDNDKAIFGAGSDLQIYHSGSNSFVKDVAQGSLLLDTNGPLVGITKDGVSEYMALFNVDGSVDLYYDNSKKLATTSTGIDVRCPDILQR